MNISFCFQDSVLQCRSRRPIEARRTRTRVQWWKTWSYLRNCIQS